jgi:hypothetical protein
MIQKAAIENCAKERIEGKDDGRQREMKGDERR